MSRLFLLLKVWQAIVWQTSRKLHVGTPQPDRKAVMRGGCFWGMLFLAGLISDMAIAQPRRKPVTNALPTELQTLLENRPNGPIISADTPSQEGFTVPSLWWTNEQFGEKLVSDWKAYGVGQVGNQQINVMVRPELWTRYTYFERYAFVLKFGSDASNFGYQLMVLDSQDFVLGAYTCDFAQSDPHFIPSMLDGRSQPIPDYVDPKSTQALPCRLWLNPNYPRSVF